MPVFRPLPASVTAPCDTPPLPEVVTVSSLVNLTARLYDAIEHCNNQLLEIRKIQPK